jgi:hypothetical protein
MDSEEAELSIAQVISTVGIRILEVNSGHKTPVLKEA